jgi:hypothetical protein
MVRRLLPYQPNGALQNFFRKLASLAFGHTSNLLQEGVSRKSGAVQYADTEYRALFRVDGQLRVDGTLYDSPSAAARACTKRTMNGWQFWKVRVKGEWVPLATLRR